MSYRRSIAKAATVTAIGNVAGNEGVWTDLYEAGATMVLRQVALREVRLFREHIGSEYVAAERHSNDVDVAYEKLEKSLSGPSKIDLEQYNDAVRRLELESLDAGFIAGFLAGYRFLKEITPE